MNELQKKLKNVVRAFFINENNVQEYMIDEKVKELRNGPSFAALTDTQVEEVTADIKSELSIKLDKGALLEESSHQKWFLSKKGELDMDYWERYKLYLIGEKGFSTNVVNTMDDILDTLTDLLGDPSRDIKYNRRGLVIGDVQSGKTANYTGLICKAADSGYKVIVLLTGVIEKLRQQTQHRIDEGFVGADSNAMMKQKDDKVIIGAGKYNSSIRRPMVLTSRADDFKAKNATNLNFDLRNTNGPVVFVVKKNVGVLKRLNKWLGTYNGNGIGQIDHSLLVIDDESDNASVNTKQEDNPTQVNAEIRTLLHLFTKSSYVGFTATPFANIFIDPDTEDEMYAEDLFPKDYIYSLNAPSNYIGARDIYNEGSKYNYMTVKINDDTDDPKSIARLLPLSHKQNYRLTEIPEDMKTAIATFVLANTIEDLRGLDKNHRSMLINVSRFTNVQDQVASLVNDYLKNLQSACKVYGNLNTDQATKNEYLLKLKTTYESIYASCGIEWRAIQNQLRSSSAGITIQIFNTKSGQSFSYDDYKDGLRVIAVGGMSLSRGLTLEGLVVSYFYRNSKMYDTLMQMGRWCGYREKYEDLCRIFMSEESIEWYRFISEATDELRNDVKQHEDTGLTPKEFGLRVRSDITSLIVTARNKMRNAKSRECLISLSGEVVETPEIYSSKERNTSNLQSIMDMARDLENDNFHIVAQKNKKTPKYGYINIPKSYIIDLLGSINISPKNMRFNPSSIEKFIEEYKGDELDMWDIVFATGDSKELFNLGNGVSFHYPTRIFKMECDGKLIRINGAKNRLGVITDAEYGISEDVIAKVKERKKLSFDNSEKPSERDYFRLVDKRNPLLILYLVELKERSDGKNTKEVLDAVKEHQGTPVVGFGIGIPNLKDQKTKYAKYVLNKVALEQGFEGEADDSDFDAEVEVD